MATVFDQFGDVTVTLDVDEDTDQIEIGLGSVQCDRDQLRDVLRAITAALGDDAIVVSRERLREALTEATDAAATWHDAELGGGCHATGCDSYRARLADELVTRLTGAEEAGA